ncbi:MAG: 3-methyl-2-oxobutanoate hydroxymethyltransferase [Alphaproteobacteria bacterium]|nr:3-methyl-2-oxobutanoate hydroxymethyltransferase [Alphaproteobacteria bacterium]
MRLTLSDIQSRKNPDEPLVCLTAYTTPMARSLCPHVDLLLVGDSVGTVLYGMPDTTGVTLDMMIQHGRAVMRAAPDVPVIIDMPYGTYEDSPAQALSNARRILQETGAHGVKLEGGVDMAEIIAALTDTGIAVMGHIGLQPQSVKKDGGYKIKGKTSAQIEALMADARAVENAGVFALVIEGTIAETASQLTRAVGIPTIGIGGSPECDGQILVTEDLLGLLHGHKPKFAREYAHLRGDIDKAAARFADDVRKRTFPLPDNLYTRSTGKT